MHFLTASRRSNISAAWCQSLIFSHPQVHTYQTERKRKLRCISGKSGVYRKGNPRPCLRVYLFEHFKHVSHLSRVLFITPFAFPVLRSGRNNNLFRGVNSVSLRLKRGRERVGVKSRNSSRGFLKVSNFRLLVFRYFSTMKAKNHLYFRRKRLQNCKNK